MLTPFFSFLGFPPEPNLTNVSKSLIYGYNIFHRLHLSIFGERGQGELLRVGDNWGIVGYCVLSRSVIACRHEEDDVQENR